MAVLFKVDMKWFHKRLTVSKGGQAFVMVAAIGAQCGQQQQSDHLFPASLSNKTDE